MLALKPTGTRLGQICVATSVRSKGIGKLFLDHAKARFRQGFWLRTQTPNRQAHRFYEREGLRHARNEPYPRYPNELFRIYEWTPG